MDRDNHIEMLQTAILQAEQSLYQTRSVMNELNQRCLDSLERHADAQSDLGENVTLSSERLSPAYSVHR